ncbi:MAG: class I SAM-dependent methyltransferase [Magnetococcales bacterium]|nr:class I SAM-dependent methyltransferase [Magnetococcales bacterium]
MKPYQPVVLKILRELKPASILDAPSGSGWLGNSLDRACEIDGLDLYTQHRPPYGRFANGNLDEGIPDDFPTYDCIVSCEGIEHLLTPALFMRHAKNHLNPGGTIILTTPNVWYPGAKLQYFLRGFFPSFPNLVDQIKPGSHMHVTPWSFPQLYLVLRLLGFENITLHPTDVPAPKHFYERILGLPHALYCRSKLRQAQTPESRDFWQMAGSPASLYARGLVVSATV